MKLSIIIPVFNNVHFTKALLGDLLYLGPEYEIIIVDNGSIDKTAEICLELYNSWEEAKPKLKIIKNEVNLGFAKACNLGYLNSVGKNVLFLNNDVRLTDQSQKESWPEILIKYCKEEKLVGPTAGILTKEFNFIQETDYISEDTENKLFYMSGWCLAGSKEIFDKLIINNYSGPFSEEFGLAYFEDTDLSLRAKQLNIKCYIQTVPLYHIGRQTSKKLNISELYLKAKNIFIKKWNKNGK